MKTKMNPIQLKLLQCLSQMKEPVSAQFLANSFGLSSRTIRNNLNNLNSCLEQSDFMVESKTGKGYKLVVFDQQKQEQFFRKNTIRNLPRIVNTARIDRTHLIIRYLLCKGSYTKIEELADFLYINETTVKQSISDAKIILQAFELDIKSRSKYGMKITGSEQNVRLCLNYEYEYYVVSSLCTAQEEVYGHTYSMDPVVLNRIGNYILSCQEKYVDCNLSPSSIGYLSRFLIISSLRNKNGYELQYREPMVVRSENQCMDGIAKAILNQCTNKLHGVYTNEDVALLKAALASFRVILNKDALPAQEYFGCKKTALELVDYLTRVNDFTSIRNDIELIEDIALHLSGLFRRSKYHFHTTQFKYEVQAHCSLMARKLAIQAFVFLHNQYEIEINEEEITHLAMVIQPVFGRCPAKINKVNACCVSDVDKSVGIGIAERLMRNFNRYIDHIDVLELYELKGKDLGQYKILFTSYNADKLNFLPEHITVFKLNIFMDDIMKQRIRYYFLNEVHLKNYQMRQFLKKDYIFLDVDVRTKESCIDVMANHMHDILECPEDFKKDLNECEQIMESQPRNNVVFLSGLRSHTKVITIALFILKHPILWNHSMDRAQVIIYWDRGKVPQDAQCFENEYIPHLMSEVFWDRSVIDELLKNTDYDQLISRLDNYMLTYLTFTKGLDS